MKRFGSKFLRNSSPFRRQGSLGPCFKWLSLRLELLRPRTWFLSLGGILWGALLAGRGGEYSGLAWLWALLCAWSLQLLSNLANDYGDRDIDRRRSPRAPRRLLALGWIAPREALFWLGGSAFLAVGSGLMLLATAEQWAWLPLGAAALYLALAYSWGARPLSRRPGSELWAGLCFGPLAVAGSAYLLRGAWDARFLYLACSWGFAAVLVLHMNHSRDAEWDAGQHKKTLANQCSPSGRRLWALAFLAAHGLFLALDMLGRRPEALYLLLPWLLYLAWILRRQDFAALLRALPFSLLGAL